jgi:copper chaperone CopZ
MKQVLFILLATLAFDACNSPQKTADKAQAAPVMVEAKLRVEGMHCDDCEASIAKGVNALAGIDSISANHEDSTAFVRFNSNKTSLKDISKAIEDRGFVVATK